MAKSSLQIRDGNTMSRPDRRYWATTPIYSSELKFMYHLGLADAEKLTDIKLEGADPANRYQGRGTAAFTFPTPPQSYEVSEPAATIITPTQNGGKFVESHGNIFKDIRISGTVGIRPAPAANDLLSAVGAPASVTSALPGVNIGIPSLANKLLGRTDERGLVKEEITGHDDIIFLRNIFRGYYDIKRGQDTDRARRTVMIWKYRKEDEAYIVEPISFDTRRDSSNPLSWNYSIVLKTLYRLDDHIKYVADPVDAFQKVVDTWQTVKQAVRDLATGINQIVSSVEFALHLPFNLASDVLNLATNVIDALSRISNFDKKIKQIGKTAINNLGNDARRLRESAQVFIRNGNHTFGSTIPAETGVISAANAEAIHANNVVRGAVLIARTCVRLLSQNSLFQESKQIQVTDYASAYSQDGEVPISSGSLLDLNNVVIPSSAREVDINRGDSIRSLANQYLGNEASWKLLVILNNLRSPYITPTPQNGTLSPGQKILIPKSAEDTDVNNVLQNELQNDAAKRNLSPVVRQYGRDIKLTDGGSGVDYSDVEVGANGDLATVEGIPNVEQSVKVKFSTEQGELALHPTFGSLYPIGSKISLGVLQEFYLNTRRTFLQDSRVDRIDQLQLFVDGDVVRVSSKIALKQSDAKLPVSFTVRRV